MACVFSCPGRSAEPVGRISESVIRRSPPRRRNTLRYCALQLARLWRRRVEHQRKAVHAVAQAGRLRAVVEDVAEMAAAAAAVDFGAQHAGGAILGSAGG